MTKLYLKNFFETVFETVFTLRKISLHKSSKTCQIVNLNSLAFRSDASHFHKSLWTQHRSTAKLLSQCQLTPPPKLGPAACIYFYLSFFLLIIIFNLIIYWPQNYCKTKKQINKQTKKMQQAMGATQENLAWGLREVQTRPWRMWLKCD